MRLIDADALIQKRSHAKNYSPDMYVIGQGYVMDAPTVDAVPVVRGEWIRMDETQALLSVEWKCSQCGQEIRVDGILTANGAGWKYCPNCGCDMRGERDGEK